MAAWQGGNPYLQNYNNGGFNLTGAGYVDDDSGGVGGSNEGMMGTDMSMADMGMDMNMVGQMQMDYKYAQDGIQQQRQYHEAQQKQQYYQAQQQQQEHIKQEQQHRRQQQQQQQQQRHADYSQEQTRNNSNVSAHSKDSGAYSDQPNQEHQHQQQQQQQPSQDEPHGPGAGPLPAGFGLPPQTSTNTLTEFTKRRNWSQRILEELKDFLHILTPDGRILYVSPNAKSLTGYESEQLVGRFIAEFVHPDDGGIFTREFNEAIASGHALRFFYRFKREDGSYIIFECDGHPHISYEGFGNGNGGNGGNEGDGLNTPPVAGGQPVHGTCRGFFMMARPYPTKNAALLDSFLEHKIENERLMRRIAELKREELEEKAEQDRFYRENPASTSQAGRSPSETDPRILAQLSTQMQPSQLGNTNASPTPDYEGMPPPAKPSMPNTALTRQALDSALSAQKPDSIADKMARYEAQQTTHLESIELLTGLRYRDGERSHGISTGDTSPALIRGDAGIAILLDRDRDRDRNGGLAGGADGSKRDKKKLRVAEEYVCADCGTLDSPEWRKGPRGPKTLCNACGLRWAKKEKKDKKDEAGDESPLDANEQEDAPPAGDVEGAMGGGDAAFMPGPGTVASGIAQPPALAMHGSMGSS